MYKMRYLIVGVFDACTQSFPWVSPGQFSLSLRQFTVKLLCQPERDWDDRYGGHTYNPSTLEMEAGRSRVQSQPGLYHTLFKMNKNKYIKQKQK